MRAAAAWPCPGSSGISVNGRRRHGRRLFRARRNCAAWMDQEDRDAVAEELIAKCDAILHLAFETIALRWVITAKNTN